MNTTYTVRRDDTVRTISVDIHRGPGDVLLDAKGGPFVPRWGVIRVDDVEGVRATLSGPMVKQNGEAGERRREVIYTNRKRWGWHVALSDAPKWVRDLVAEVTQ